MKTHNTRRIYRVRCKSGLMGWRTRLRNLYANFREYKDFDSNHGLAIRAGYNTAQEAWRANPVLEGSVKTSDYRKVKP